MKLLVIMSSQSRGGVEEHAIAICKAAIAQSWHVEVAFPDLPATKGLIDDFEQAGARYQPLAIAETAVGSASTLSELVKTMPLRLRAWLEKPLHFIRVLAHLWRDRPDVVLINLPWADHGLTSVLACALLNQPAAVVFHLIPWPLSLSALKLKLYQWAGDRNQTWIGISENNRQLISASFHRPAEKISRIYNGVALDEVALAASPIAEEKRDRIRRELRQSLGIAEETLLLLTVARLDTTQKGYDYLIPTLPHLSKQFPNMHCAWVGDGPQREVLARQLDDYGVRSLVSILGYREDVPALLLAADLFVFPTYFEGFPFALLEAMVCNVPIVAADVNGIPEIVEQGIHGLLTRQGDSCDLLESLRWAIAHPEEMQAMASRAAQRVRAFSQVKMCAEMLDVLETTAGDRQKVKSLKSA